jgi:hypothetical protein
MDADDIRKMEEQKTIIRGARCPFLLGYYGDSRGSDCVGTRCQWFSGSKCLAVFGKVMFESSLLEKAGKEKDAFSRAMCAFADSLSNLAAETREAYKQIPRGSSNQDTPRGTRG